jgi:hypothetical protein
MISKPSVDGLTFTLDCFSKPVRVYMSEGCPWFEASALCAAMGIDPAEIDRFNRDALDTDIAEFAFDAEPVFVLSPIGHFKFVEDHLPEQYAKYAAWSRREAAKLVPDPAADDAHLCLTLRSDGSRPQRPSRFTGRVPEWKELLFLPAYRTDRAIAMERYRTGSRAAPEEAQTNDEGIQRLLARVAERSGYTLPLPPL